MKIKTMEKIPILFVIDNLAAAGAQRQFVELVKRIDRQKYNLSVCCISRKGPLEKELSEAGISVDLIGKKYSFEFPIILFKFLHYVRIKNPVIIQSFLFYSNNICRIVGRIVKIPIIISSKRTKTYRLKFSFFLILVDKLMAKYSHTITANFKSKDAIYIPNGIDMAKYGIPLDNKVLLFLREKYSVSSTDRVLLSVGRLVEEKGYEFLFKALAQIKDTYPTLKLLIIGEGPLKNRLKQLVQDFNLSNHILIIGYQNNVKPFYHLCDLFISSSLNEGMSNVIMEAMASRKAVIATDVGQTCDLIINHKTGLLVPPRNFEILKNKIAYLLNAKNKRISLANSAYERIKNNFSAELMANRYMKLYEKMVNDKQSLF